MPIYTFTCDKCKKNFEQVTSIAQYNGRAIHSECGEESQKRDFQAEKMAGFMKERTLGAVADKNTAKMSEDEKDALFMKHNEYRKGEAKLPPHMRKIKREIKRPKTERTNRREVKRGKRKGA